MWSKFIELFALTRSIHSQEFELEVNNLQIDESPK